MPNSARFSKLTRRVATLETRLLPPIDPSGRYTAAQQDLIRSFRLLVHAELESFLEDRALEIADTALNAFLIKHKTGQGLASLMAYSPLSAQPPPPSARSGSTDTPSVRVRRIVAHYKHSVSHGNHGIKEKNIVSMLFPVGFLESELDTTLLGTLSSYGSNRGSTAHKAAHTQIPIDPAAEIRTVRWIVAELEKLDIVFTIKKKSNK